MTSSKELAYNSSQLNSKCIFRFNTTIRFEEIPDHDLSCELFNILIDERLGDSLFRVINFTVNDCGYIDLVCITVRKMSLTEFENLYIDFWSGDNSLFRYKAYMYTDLVEVEQL